MTAQPHVQIPARVTAFVDAGIKELVEILNTFDDLWSFESCEGGTRESAYVYLCCGSYRDADFDKLANTVHNIAEALSKVLEQQNSIVPVGYDIHVGIQWWGDKKCPFMSVELPHKSIRGAISIFSVVKQRLFGGI
jgi:hypothetical protein